MKNILCLLIALLCSTSVFAKEISLDVFNAGIKLVFDTEKGFSIRNDTSTNSLSTKVGTIETNLLDFLKTQNREEVRSFTVKGTKVEKNDLVISGKGKDPKNYDTVVVKGILDKIDIGALKSQSGLTFENGFLTIDPDKMTSSEISIKTTNTLGTNNVGSKIVIIAGNVGGDVVIGGGDTITTNNQTKDQGQNASNQEKSTDDFEGDVQSIRFLSILGVNPQDIRVELLWPWDSSKNSPYVLRLDSEWTLTDVEWKKVVGGDSSNSRFLFQFYNARTKKWINTMGIELNFGEVMVFKNASVFWGKYVPQNEPNKRFKVVDKFDGILALKNKDGVWEIK